MHATSNGSLINDENTGIDSESTGLHNFAIILISSNQENFKLIFTVSNWKANIVFVQESIVSFNLDKWQLFSQYF